MVIFFNNLSEFKAQVVVNNSFCIENIEAAAYKAGKERLEKWLGSSLYEALIIAHQNNTATAAEQALILHIQRSLANFAMLEYVPQATVQVSDAGITRQEHENYRTAYKYQIEELSRSLTINGFFHLEQILLYLEANAMNFPTWDASCAREFFVNYERDFSRYVKLKEGRWLFDSLQNMMRSVEAFSIEPKLGSALFAQIKQEILTGALSVANKKLVEKLTPAIAHFTAHEAAKQNWVSLSHDGLQFIEQKGDDAMKHKHTASDTQASLYIRSHWEHANRFLNLAMMCIEQNPNDYPLYVQPTAEEDDCGCSEEVTRCSCGCQNCGCGSGKNKHLFLL